MNDLASPSGHRYELAGVMSGSSLDGLDVAHCVFTRTAQGWEYEIIKAETFTYPAGLREELHKLSQIPAEAFAHLSVRLGHYIGDTLKRFFSESEESRIRYIASHGHTAFHNPAEGYTCQIGDGASIAAITGIPTITDFRSMDVALGGQGAPLVPIGDALLFHQYEFCLNLGGYSNISWSEQGRRRAFDISPVNKAINLLARQIGRDIDFNGSLARKGNISPSLLAALNNLDYYRQPPPKSLGDGWFNQQFMPLIHQHQDLSVADQLRTLYEHIALQLAAHTRHLPPGKMLVTGGGAHNTFLMEVLQHHTPHRLIKPSPKVIDFKEALIFALMGLLRIRNENNCLASATGASRDNCGGVVHTI